ncbi:MAG: hypothetical protein ACOYIF_07335 [Acetivibrionales bacterium]
MKKYMMLALALLFVITHIACSQLHNSSGIQQGERRDKVQDLLMNNSLPGGLAMVEKDARIPIVADHKCIDINNVPPEWAEKAKKELHIAYGHTSHGSQITYGLLGMTYFKGEAFTYLKGNPEGSLDLRDNPFGREMDLGNPDNKTWAIETRNYLRKNKDINVVMWSWCGQLSKGDHEFVQAYLDQMQALENEFPNVIFIYMTGHLDGTGEEGVLWQNNNKIREFCLDNNKVLFDFADIESYNPDGEYFGDKYSNDGCWYDSDNDKTPDKNWAQEWQKTHKKGVDWYDCYSAHSEPVNANMKAAAMWWLLARICGYAGHDEKESIDNKPIEYYALKLKDLGLFVGSDSGLNLDEIPNRLQAAIMLTRLSGGEAEALRENYRHPFADGLYGDAYIGYLYHHKLTYGMSAKKFGSEVKIDAHIYMTFLLRVLGYSDTAGDFRIDTALQTAGKLGVISQDYFTYLSENSFTRGDMAKLTYFALKQKIRGEDITLLEKLVQQKLFDKEAAEIFLKNK